MSEFHTGRKSAFSFLLIPLSFSQLHKEIEIWTSSKFYKLNTIEIYENGQNENASVYQLQLKMKKRDLVYNKQQFFAQVKQVISILSKDRNVFLLTKPLQSNQMLSF